MAQAVAWELVKRAAQGQADARRALVEATLDDLWGLAMRLTRRQDEAEAVVQETYARALAALPHLTPQGRFEGFLARVATNLVLERWRRRRPAADVSEVEAASGDPEPWQAVAQGEEHGRLLAAAWQAIRTLPPEPRAAMLLFYAQGQSCRQVAEVMDVPVGTVKTWLHRGRSQVRREAERILRSGAAGLPGATGNERNERCASPSGSAAQLTPGGPLGCGCRRQAHP